VVFYSKVLWLSRRQLNATARQTESLNRTPYSFPRVQRYSSRYIKLKVALLNGSQLDRTRHFLCQELQVTRPILSKALKIS
jgi:hypothetical protein